MSADNPQGRTQENGLLYRVEYKCEGAESGGFGSQTFRASDDSGARKRAGELVGETERKGNSSIENRFYHSKYSIIRIVRIEQEEISRQI